MTGRWLRRLPLRFSLRTLLIVTACVALAVWWQTRSHVEIVTFPDGSQMRFRQQYLKTGDDPEPRMVRGGPCVLLSASGRLLCRGRFVHDLAEGTWTYFDDRGRTVLAGPVQHSLRAGVWTIWDAQGRRRAEVRHDPNPNARPPTGSSRYDFGVSLGGAIRCGPRPVLDAAQRHPERSHVREYWDTGQLQAEGNYVQDRRHGDWSRFSRDGRRESRQEFREGRPIAPTHRTLDELGQALLSSSWRDRDDALADLETLGPAAVPTLVTAAKSGDDELRRLVLRQLLELRPNVSHVQPLAALTEHADVDSRLLAQWLFALCDGARRASWFTRLLDEAQRHPQLLECIPDQTQEFAPELAAVIESGDTGRCRAALAFLHPPCYQPWLTKRWPADRLRQILEAAARHPDAEIAQEAASLLQRFQATPPN